MQEGSTACPVWTVAGSGPGPSVNVQLDQLSSSCPSEVQAVLLVVLWAAWGLPGSGTCQLCLLDTFLLAWPCALGAGEGLGCGVGLAGSQRGQGQAWQKWTDVKVSSMHWFTLQCLQEPGQRQEPGTPSGLLRGKQGPTP